MQKVHYNPLRALIACKFKISVTISTSISSSPFSSFIYITSSLSIANIYLGLADGSAIFKH